MPSDMESFLDRVASGDQALDQEGLEQFKAILVSAEEGRSEGDLSYEEKERRRMEDDHDYENTFSEVVAAWIDGSLNDEQYNILRAAATPENTEPPEGEESEEEPEEMEESPDDE